jgi:hypothetical protein
MYALNLNPIYLGHALIPYRTGINSIPGHHRTQFGDLEFRRMLINIK